MTLGDSLFKFAVFLQAEVLGIDPGEVSVPVVGGHAGITILPLLSQVSYAGDIALEILILTIKKNLALENRNC
jgi:malate/lactate dehydrogenase